MTATLALSLLLALASATALNWAFYRQHGQVSGLPPLSLSHPVRSLRLLFSNRRWLVGFAVGILGWAFYGAALRYGPLSLVQASSAGGIGVLALLVWRWGGVTLSRREWVGVGVSIGGLVALGLSMVGGGRAQHLGGPGSWTAIALWLLVSGLVAGLFAGPGRRLVAPGAGFAIGAGLLYAAGDVATKAAIAGGWRLLFVPALLAAHGLAFVMLQLAFQRGKALATAGVATLFTNAVPIAAGMAVFHEPLPGGIRGFLRVLAFAAVVAGAVLLTRSTQPTETTVAPPPRRLSRARRVAVLSLAATIVVAAAAAGRDSGSAARAPAPAPRSIAQTPVARLLPRSFVQIDSGPSGGTLWHGLIRNSAAPAAVRPTVIYLPPGASTRTRYPVLYLLHGFPGSPYQFSDGLRLARTADRAISTRQVRPFIAVVPPAGLTAKYRGEWTGTWEAYLVRDVVPWTDRHLPTLATRSRRAVAGLSAGGYGAVVVGLRHPSLFGTIESWSGSFVAPHDGSLAHASAAQLAAHDPSLLVRREQARLRALGIRFFLSSGTNDDRASEAAAVGFARELRALGLPHRLLLGAGGHNGKFWRAQLPAALRYALPPTS